LCELQTFGCIGSVWWGSDVRSLYFCAAPSPAAWASLPPTGSSAWLRSKRTPQESTTTVTRRVRALPLRRDSTTQGGPSVPAYSKTKAGGIYSDGAYIVSGSQAQRGECGATVYRWRTHCERPVAKVWHQDRNMFRTGRFP